MGPTRRGSPEFDKEIAAEVAAVSGLPRATLIERWTAAYGRPPPKGISRRLLEYSAAYQIQAAAYGGLPAPVIRKLMKAAEQLAVGKPVTTNSPSSRLRPGTRLVREWNGRTHTVEVTEGGFLWSGRPYRSLSAIAREITGARWSGPRFFGL
ncbi:MAG: DUF2924 domain-containing protein [Bauldia sp.]|nr:DUF2924 domain-containing protein [Bauldia sp.]